MQAPPAQLEVDRLLEETWSARHCRAPRRETIVEGAAGVLFVGVAAALLVLTGAAASLDLRTAAFLLALYVAVARVEFPIGAGHVVPTQLVLVPMLILLPPGAVPALVALGLVAGAALDWRLGRIAPRRVLSAVPDSWHAVGPALVLVAAGSPHIGADQLPLMGLAFAACCAADCAAVLGRAALTRPQRDLAAFAQVVAIVWIVDACLAPIGFVVGVAAESHLAATLMVLPLVALFLFLGQDRNRRIDQAHRRLKLVGHERERLQAAVRRLGDAFAAKHDLRGLLEILLQGSIEAVDAAWGRVELAGPHGILEVDAGQAPEAQSFLLVVPMTISADEHPLAGELRLVRALRPFEDDEAALLRELARKAEMAGSEILEHRALRDQAETDGLTGLGNRRKLREDLAASLDRRGRGRGVLLLFDLDGFKSYNDTFGHLAGDALLMRVAAKLARATEPEGRAYRLGGDEFCALLEPRPADVEAIVERCREALSESGDDFSIQASCGAVALPDEADSADAAIQLADRRMYANKRGRSTRPRDHARDVLLRTMQLKQPELDVHAYSVADLALRVARRLGLTGETLEEIVRAAELHDVGKVGIPDAILNKSRALDESEWDFMRQHTILGERILHAAPALRPVARLVRASHERWDGGGYPDRIGGAEIPLGARIVAVCDAYEAMTSNRPYREALDHRVACEELRETAGSQFDPRVVTAFLAVAEEERERLGAARRFATSAAASV